MSTTPRREKMAFRRARQSRFGRRRRQSRRRAGEPTTRKRRHRKKPKQKRQRRRRFSRSFWRSQKIPDSVVLLCLSRNTSLFTTNDSSTPPHCHKTILLETKIDSLQEVVFATNERTNERRVVEDYDHLLRSSNSSSTRLVVRSFDVPLSLKLVDMVDERQLEREVYKETPLFPLRCVFGGRRRRRRPSFFSFSLSMLLVLLVCSWCLWWWSMCELLDVHESSEYTVCVNKAR